jgi:hypothetical protein
MGKKPEISTVSLSQKSSDGAFTTGTNGATEGYVFTPHGIVYVWMYEGTAYRAPMVDIRVCANGRKYGRRITGRRYSKQYVVTLAGRFAKEVAEGKG